LLPDPPASPPDSCHRRVDCRVYLLRRDEPASARGTPARLKDAVPPLMGGYIAAKSLAQEFAPGSVLVGSQPVYLSCKVRRERDGDGPGGSHL